MLKSYNILATHLIGGDMTYKCIDYNPTLKKITYEITFDVYRDGESNTPFDSRAYFGVFKGSGSNWTQYGPEVFRHPLLQDKKVDVDTRIPCLDPPSLKVFHGVYKFQIIVDASATESYLVVYQRYLRNATISNIKNPDKTGASFVLEIVPGAQSECMDSPRFSNSPPTILCVGEPIDFDHEIDEIPGTTTEYSFFNPLMGGGPKTSPAEACDGIWPNASYCKPPYPLVEYTGNYTYQNPMFGMSINPKTGKLSGTPSIQGQFLIGIQAKTYRDGVLIGKITRDFQFNVFACEPQVYASIKSDAHNHDGSHTIKLCNGLDIHLINTSTKESAITSYEWRLEGKLISTERDLKTVLPRPGEYNVKLSLNKESKFEKCKDEIDINLGAYNEVKASFVHDSIGCDVKPIGFEDQSISDFSIVTYNWAHDAKMISSTEKFSHQFTTPGKKIVKLTVEDEKGCKGEQTKELLYFPVDRNVKAKPSKYILCTPETLKLEYLSTPVSDGYDVSWEFDGNIIKGINPSYTFEKSGQYTVNVKITSPSGCQASKSYQDWISVKEGPIASFDYNPKELSTSRNEVTFSNTSKRADNYLWLVAEKYMSRDKDPIHTFADTGKVKVTLIAYHPNTCTDTATVDLDIVPINTLFVPNAYTPDGDGLNDLFFGKGYLGGVKDYKMVIYNRWGDEVYSTTDIHGKWNGRRQNTGSKCPEGSYAYRISYRDTRNSYKLLKGLVTLLR